MNSRRSIDDIIVKKIESIEEHMTTLTNNYSNFKEEIKEQNANIDKNVSLLTQSINDKVIPFVVKHEKVLYGSSETPGESGIIADSVSIKRDMKNTKYFFGIFGSIATFLLYVISNFEKITNFFNRR